MPRQNRRRRDDGGDADSKDAGRGAERLEPGPDGDWVVRSVSGAAATKAYRCPGCDHEIRPATPHVVVWPQGDEGIEHRRHWHGACWAARGRRAPNVQRPRRGPRY